MIYMRYHLSAYTSDGMIIIWSPTTSPHASSYGSDLAPEDLQYEKEHWKPRTTFRYECWTCAESPESLMIAQLYDYAGL